MVNGEITDETVPGYSEPGDSELGNTISGDYLVCTAEQADTFVSRTPQEVFGVAFDVAQRYEDILATKGIEWGLIGPRERERLWERHILNSLAIADFLQPNSSIIDVGSGAGLPGIPLAIARPDCTFTLLEPLLRRFNFLTETVAELGLESQVKVVRGRAEDHQDRYDYVVCRAVAPLTKLLKWCVPLLNPTGELLALKGESAPNELADAQQTLKKQNLTGTVKEVPTPTGAPTRVIQIRRAS